MPITDHMTGRATAENRGICVGASDRELNPDDDLAIAATKPSLHGRPYSRIVIIRQEKNAVNLNLRQTNQVQRSARSREGQH